MNQTSSGNTSVNPVDPAETYDYIIIGAGSAGCVIARRLIDQTDATVLLIEAGPAFAGQENVTNPVKWPFNIGSELDYGYHYAPSPFLNNRSIPAPRGKIIGGSGSINGMVWARGHEDDYNEWAALGNEGWDFESVLPLFKKIEDWEGGETSFHGKEGPIPVENAKNLHPVPQALIDSCKSYGLPFLDDTGGLNPVGTGAMSLTVRDGKRTSSYTGYLEPVLGHKNLTVLTEATVQRLLLINDKCFGVEFKKGNALYSVHARHETILSAGAFDTPRILMLSGIGPEYELLKLGIKPVINLPGVGHNLIDHPTVSSLLFEPMEPLTNFNNNMAGATLYWKSEPSKRRTDVMLLPVQVPFLTPELAAVYPPTADTFSILPTLVQPQSKGYVKMLSADPAGPLEIQPNLLASESDMKAMLHAVELVLDLSNEPAFRKIIKRMIAPSPSATKNELIDFIKMGANTYYHPVGTCAMGKGANAVVNNLLQVRGVENLRIADASVMPEITTGNTNAPTMMIAEFAAQLLIPS